MCWFDDNPKHLPKSTGPYLPGCMDVMVGYSKDGFLVRMYYPTDAVETDKTHKKWPAWFPDNSYVTGAAKVLMTYPIILRILLWWTDYLRIPALFGEKIRKLPTNHRFPFIVFSHGLGGSRFLYTNIFCELASRGYVIAAVEHRDNSACNTFYYRSKEAAKSDEREIIDFKHVKLGEGHLETRQKQVRQRAEECGKVLDFFSELNRGVERDDVFNDNCGEFDLKDFVGRLEMEDVSLMGHSFGAATALLALSQRTEFKRAILMDPWMFPIQKENLDKSSNKPVLFINTETFHVKVNVDAMSKFLHGEHRKMYTILGTTHEHQTDTPLLFGIWLNLFMRKLKPVKALKINNSMILTFLDSYRKCPTEIEDCRDFLKGTAHLYRDGLTKPWA